METRSFFITTTFLVLLFCLNVTAQSERNVVEPSGCQENADRLENVARLLESRDDGSFLFINAHLGDGEKSDQLNWKRLYKAREYIWTKLPSAYREPIYILPGEPNAGFGSLDLYLGENLIETLT